MRHKNSLNRLCCYETSKEVWKWFEQSVAMKQGSEACEWSKQRVVMKLGNELWKWSDESTRMQL